MDTPIYFTKVEFKDKIGDGNVYRIFLLDTVLGELSYQVYYCEKKMPSIVGYESYEINGIPIQYNIGRPAKIIKSGKNSFKRVLLPDEQYNQKVAFSYGIKLSKAQIQRLLPYCNALEFEPYRNRKMSMDDDGFIGYRDEITLHFTGITNSYISKMEWDMNYYYDENHIWPSEKLYRYLILEYFQDNKKLRNWAPSYGECSLFF